MVLKVTSVFLALVSLFLLKSAHSSPVSAGVSGKEQADVVVGLNVMYFIFGEPRNLIKHFYI